jgi:hypothetical protein
MRVLAAQAGLMIATSHNGQANQSLAEKILRICGMFMGLNEL